MYTRASELRAAGQQSIDSRAVWQQQRQFSARGGEDEEQPLSEAVLEQLQQRLGMRRQLEEEAEAEAAAAPHPYNPTPLCAHSTRHSTIHTPAPPPAPRPLPSLSSLFPSPSTSPLLRCAPPVLAELDWQGCVELLRDFVVAHTLKDCSLIANCIASSSGVEEEEGGGGADHQGRAHSGAAFHPASHPFAFSLPFTSQLHPPRPVRCCGRVFLSVVDLELKAVERIPSYFELDQLIVHSYARQHRRTSVHTTSANI